MRRRLTVALIILNVLLGFGILAQNARTQIIPRGLFDCCKGGPEGTAVMAAAGSVAIAQSIQIAGRRPQPQLADGGP